MKVTEEKSPTRFLARNRALLEQDEAGNNLLLGLLALLSEREEKGDLPQYHRMGKVETADGETALLYLLNPLNIVLYGGEKVRQASELLADHLARARATVPGVVGPREAAEAFAAAWGVRMSVTPYVKMDQGIYRLDQVEPVPMSPGELVQAGPKDTERVAGWYAAFYEEIGEQITPSVALAKAQDAIAGGWLYLWRDGEAVSMAKKARPTGNGVVVSVVYTPPAYRGRGYATSCVAALSRLLLDSGYRFCSLYTDLANPTSNAIYSRIGYRFIQESVQYRFR
ncbi:hypothetical protein J31TS4_26900 [Paenibacillus sp. J31TS4]|uniref:GNAT family N-acetyltransferase n=1 Tax=Paenibacillus sp. J31TS4 TaxID=2807195 RepID=UPI001B2C04E9|nr:GNAT family N-acetyltransferase [Paenibacillus sp. J31TS4]GIP39410.1 hypothetical protein J31TS4_26900 [Paenibacillus sp. J31TS4]